MPRRGGWVSKAAAQGAADACVLLVRGRGRLWCVCVGGDGEGGEGGGGGISTETDSPVSAEMDLQTPPRPPQPPQPTLELPSAGSPKPAAQRAPRHTTGDMPIPKHRNAALHSLCILPPVGCTVKNVCIHCLRLGWQRLHTASLAEVHSVTAQLYTA